MDRSLKPSRVRLFLALATVWTLASPTYHISLAALSTEVVYSTSGGTRVSNAGTDSAGLTNATSGSFNGAGIAVASNGQLVVEAKLRLDTASFEKVQVTATASFEEEFTITGGRGGARLFLGFISTIATSNAVKGVATRIIAASAPNNHYLADPIDNTTPLFDSVSKFFTFDQAFTLKTEIAAWVEIQPGATGFASSRLSTLLYRVEVVNAASGFPIPFQLSTTSGASYANLTSPQLGIEPVGPAQVRIRWPASASFYSVQKALGLGQPWARLLVEPDADGDHFQLADAIVSDSSFYRLILWPR